MAIPLIIDTDIGGDIDDALALSMALHSKEFDIVGITTVYRANLWRKDIVLRMLTAYGRVEIPVRIGAENPLLGSWAAGDAAEAGQALPNEAVPFLIEQARKRDALHIAAIGPLTNVALAIAQAPDIAHRLHVHIMGGMVTCAHPEWNIQCDPEAAAVVLDSGAHCTLIGLDVTERCRLDAEQARRLVSGEGAKMYFLRGEMENFFRNFNFLPVLHDPLVMASMVWDNLLTYEYKDIRIETRGQWTRGVTVDMRFSDTRPIRTAVGVDATAAVARICARVRGED